MVIQEYEIEEVVFKYVDEYQQCSWWELGRKYRIRKNILIELKSMLRYNKNK